MSKSNAALKIEKGLPIPNTYGRKAGPLRIAFQQMQKGDSVFVTDRKRSSIVVTAHQVFGKRSYATRPEANGVRVWRVK